MHSYFLSCFHTHIHIHNHKHTHTLTHMHLHMHARTHARTHTHTHTHARCPPTNHLCRLRLRQPGTTHLCFAVTLTVIVPLSKNITAFVIEDLIIDPVPLCCFTAAGILTVASLCVCVCVWLWVSM